MAQLYADRWITCDDDGIAVRAYYFPWGTKRIAYRDVRAVRTVAMSSLRGRARLWGTSNPRYWASLDPRRPGKTQAVVLDLGRRVRPFLSPDDPAAFVAVVAARSGVTPDEGSPVVI